MVRAYRTLCCLREVYSILNAVGIRIVAKYLITKTCNNLTIHLANERQTACVPLVLRGHGSKKASGFCRKNGQKMKRLKNQRFIYHTRNKSKGLFASCGIKTKGLFAESGIKTKGLFRCDAYLAHRFSAGTRRALIFTINLTRRREIVECPPATRGRHSPFLPFREAICLKFVLFWEEIHRKFLLFWEKEGIGRSCRTRDLSRCRRVPPFSSGCMQPIVFTPTGGKRRSVPSAPPLSPAFIIFGHCCKTNFTLSEQSANLPPLFVSANGGVISSAARQRCV